MSNSKVECCSGHAVAAESGISETSPVGSEIYLSSRQQFSQLATLKFFFGIIICMFDKVNNLIGLLSDEYLNVASEFAH